MTSQEFEIVYFSAQIVLNLKTLYQVYATHKEKRSVNPLFSWMLVFVGQCLVITAGVIGDSWAIVLTGILAMPFIAYHSWVEIKRLQIKKVSDLWKIWEKT